MNKSIIPAMKKKSNVTQKLKTYSYSDGLKWRWRKIVVLIVVAIVFLLVSLIFGVKYWYDSGLSPADPASTTKVRITIELGTTADEIIDTLDDKGLLKNKRVFRWYLMREDVFNHMQAGVYEFTPADEPESIAQKLYTGQVVAEQITIVSGQRLTDIKARFVELGYSPEDVEKAFSAIYTSSILTSKPQTATLEGYIYPDTYKFPLNFAVSDVIAQTLKNFESKVSTELLTKLEARGYDLHEALTLASIIQKESSDPTLQRQISQVFQKRLADGIGLESDPTFQYAAHLLGVNASVGIDSPYNTYKNKGLPPGPIANLEISALEAVVNPTDTDYLFFVAGTDGVTRFSRTFEEHNALIAKHGVSGVE